MVFWPWKMAFYKEKGNISYLTALLKLKSGFAIAVALWRYMTSKDFQTSFPLEKMHNRRLANEFDICEKNRRNTCTGFSGHKLHQVLHCVVVGKT